MRILYGLLIILLCWVVPASAQLGPLPYQQSPAAGEGSHLFTGKTLAEVVVTWNAGTSARYFMVFDGPVPANGVTVSCTTTQRASCLEFCVFANGSTSAPNFFNTDFMGHPLAATNNTGIGVAMSSGAGCGTLTVDTGVDWFYARN